MSPLNITRIATSPLSPATQASAPSRPIAVGSWTSFGSEEWPADGQLGTRGHTLVSATNPDAFLDDGRQFAAELAKQHPVLQNGL